MWVSSIYTPTKERQRGEHQSGTQARKLAVEEEVHVHTQSKVYLSEKSTLVTHTDQLPLQKANAVSEHVVVFVETGMCALHLLQFSVQFLATQSAERQKERERERERDEMTREMSEELAEQQEA
jgi:hypothetical protein